MGGLPQPSSPFTSYLTRILEQQPNPSLYSDPACIVFRSFSSFVFLGFAQHLDAGGAGLLLSLGGAGITIGTDIDSNPLENPFHVDFAAFCNIY